MAKSFKQTPAPKPSEEAIVAFEQGGLGQDKQSHKTVNVVKLEPTKEEIEPTRRLSLDIPESWHRRFKIACTRTDKKMVGEMLDFIKRRTMELEQG